MHEYLPVTDRAEHVRSAGPVEKNEIGTRKYPIPAAGRFPRVGSDSSTVPVLVAIRAPNRELSFSSTSQYFGLPHTHLNYVLGSLFDLLHIRRNRNQYILFLYSILSC